MEHQLESSHVKQKVIWKPSQEYRAFFVGHFWKQPDGHARMDKCNLEKLIENRVEWKGAATLSRVEKNSSYSFRGAEALGRQIRLTYKRLRKPRPISSNQFLGCRLHCLQDTLKMYLWKKSIFTYFKNKYFSPTIVEQNELHPSKCVSFSYLIFKKWILELIRPSPDSIFNVYNSVNLNHLTILWVVRMLHLHKHKFRHNFQDSLSRI